MPFIIYVQKAPKQTDYFDSSIIRILGSIWTGKSIANGRTIRRCLMLEFYVGQE